MSKDKFTHSALHTAAALACAAIALTAGWSTTHALAEETKVGVIMEARPAEQPWSGAVYDALQGIVKKDPSVKLLLSYKAYDPTSAEPVARQMIVAGAIIFLAGCAHGDLARLHLAETRLTTWLGFAYLVIIGSLGGYPVYLWLMRVCPPAKAATVPYMNLLVAIFLGWSLGHETITIRLLIGTAIVLASVALVLRTKASDVIPPGD